MRINPTFGASYRVRVIDTARKPVTGRDLHYLMQDVPKAMTRTLGRQVATTALHPNVPALRRDVSGVVRHAGKSEMTRDERLRAERGDHKLYLLAEDDALNGPHDGRHLARANERMHHGPVASLDNLLNASLFGEGSILSALLAVRPEGLHTQHRVRWDLADRADTLEVEFDRSQQTFTVSTYPEMVFALPRDSSLRRRRPGSKP